jgi:hypothetical protein
MSVSASPDMPSRPPSRVVAVLLSLLAPGVGHVHVGQARRGLVLFAGLLAVQAALFAGAFLVPPRAMAVWGYAAAVTAVMFALFVFCAVDAARLAGRAAARPQRWFVTAGAVVGAWLVAAALGQLVAQLRPSRWRSR